MQQTLSRIWKSYLYFGFVIPSLYQITKITLSPGTGGVILHGSLPIEPCTASEIMSGTAIKKKIQDFSFLFFF